MSMKNKVLKNKIFGKTKNIMNRVIRMSNCRKNGIKGIKYIKNASSFYKKSGSINFKTLALLHVLAMDIVEVMHSHRHNHSHTTVLG